MKKALNVCGIIFAVIFSLALIPTLIMTPVWKGVSGLLEPEFLQNVVTEVVAELDEEDFTFDTSDITSDRPPLKPPFSWGRKTHFFR